MAATLLLLAGVAGACTSTPAEPEDVDTCDGLVDVGARLVEDLLDVTEGLPLAVLNGEEPAPPEFIAISRRGEELDSRVAQLGCDLDAINAAINDEIAHLEPTTVTGELLLDIVRSGVVSPLDLNAGSS